MCSRRRDFGEVVAVVLFVRFEIFLDLADLSHDSIPVRVGGEHRLPVVTTVLESLISKLKVWQARKDKVLASSLATPMPQFRGSPQLLVYAFIHLFIYLAKSLIHHGKILTTFGGACDTFINVLAPIIDDIA